MTDKETADQVNRLRVKANMLRMGERIAFGSDSYALECAAETIERLMRERDEARAMGRAGAYTCTPEHSWAEWLADRQKELDAARARVAELEALLDVDRLTDIITDSIDLDWTPRDAAKAIVRAMGGTSHDNG